MGGFGLCGYGLVPEGTYRKKNFQKQEVRLEAEISEAMEDLILTPRPAADFWCVWKSSMPGRH